MSYQKFRKLKPFASNTVTGAGVVKYKRLNTLGYVLAKDRINNIMQSGQRLQEAREEQYSYVGKDLLNPMSKNEQEASLKRMKADLQDQVMPEQYADKMDTADAVNKLNDKARAVKASKEAAAAKLAQQVIASNQQQPSPPPESPKV